MRIHVIKYTCHVLLVVPNSQRNFAIVNLADTFPIPDKLVVSPFDKLSFATCLEERPLAMVSGSTIKRGETPELTCG